MIHKETVLIIADNSGGKKAKCIGFYKGATSGSIGDIIMVTVFEITPTSKVERKSKKKAIIVRTRKPFVRKDTVFRFADNAIILIDEKLKPIGNRIFGETLREVKAVLPEITNLISKIY